MALLSALAIATSTPILPKTKIDKTMHVRAIPLSHLIEFRWKRFPKPKTFRGYELIRMNADGSEFLFATSTNRYSTNGADHDPIPGKNSYRLCVRLKDESRICSKLMVETFKGRKKPEAIVLGVSTSTLPTLSDPPVIPEPISPVPVLTVDLRKDVFPLNMSVSGTSQSWSWSSAVLPIAPDYWKFVRSATNPDPSYPTDGYAAHIPDPNASNLVQEVIPPGQWVRVCAVKEDAWISCSIVVRTAP